MHIVVISPHRDDAAFSLALTVRAWLQQNHSITVLNCFTRSNYAPFADVGHVHANDLVSYVSAMREREDDAWRRQLKSANLFFKDLNLKDAPLRLRCPLDEILTVPVDVGDRASSSIREALDQLDAAAVVAPLALGNHVDHRVVRAAVLGGIADKPLAFYEDLPYAAWPKVSTVLDEHLHELEAMGGTTLLPNAVTREEPAETAVAQKQSAALCYDSQIESETSTLIANFCLRYGGGERLWVTPAWSALDPALTRTLTIPPQ